MTFSDIKNSFMSFFPTLPNHSCLFLFLFFPDIVKFSGKKSVNLKIKNDWPNHVSFTTILLLKSSYLNYECRK